MMTLDPAMLFSIAAGVAAIFLGIISFFLREKLSDTQARLGRLEGKAHELEMNRASDQARVGTLVSTVELQQMLSRYATREDLAEYMARIEEMSRRLGELTTSVNSIEGMLRVFDPTPPVGRPKVRK